MGCVNVFIALLFPVWPANDTRNCPFFSMEGVTNSFMTICHWHWRDQMIVWLRVQNDTQLRLYSFELFLEGSPVNQVQNMRQNCWNTFLEKLFCWNMLDTLFFSLLIELLIRESWSCVIILILYRLKCGCNNWFLFFHSTHIVNNNAMKMIEQCWRILLDHSKQQNLNYHLFLYTSDKLREESVLNPEYFAFMSLHEHLIEAFAFSRRIYSVYDEDIPS